MRSGITLATLRDEVAIEAGISQGSGHSAFNKARLNQIINRTERGMAMSDDWPTRELEVLVTIPADTQYVALPSTINFTMITQVVVAYGDDWLPVNHKISPRERSIYNSNHRAEPIMRYEVRADRPTQFEVWPIGNVEQTLQVTGQASLGGMVEDDDVCTLDADVIVLRAAAEILGRNNQADAEAQAHDGAATCRHHLETPRHDQKRTD
ncbi:hypothetical protein P7F88_25530 [Vibrio hannami]|uniref:hypothetical protein n=1 Tax=Vibrio hannami TaxID=2717094 RepID=UPI00240F392A|nr:hypothetical protein [Vibrio hannami]MDG3089228.1 hypothetical protein [Vibrio hannami]